MKAVLTWYATSAEIERFRKVMPPNSTLFAPLTRPHLSRFEVRFDDLAHEVVDADVMIGWAVPEGIFPLAKALKALVWCHAGCDELDMPMLKSRGVQVASIRGANSVAVAEHAMALLLAVAKRIVLKHQAVLDAHWEPPGGRPEYEGALLQNKTLLVVGLGAIGTAIAKRAAAFDMKVIGIRRHPEKGHEIAEDIYGPAELNKALGLADFIMLAAPLTKETTQMIDAGAISAMKPTAFLINIARGNMIEERPLYEALSSNHLAGYASDVWWFYSNAIPATYHFPIPSRTGLQRLKNVVATGNQASAGVAEVKEQLIIDAAVKNFAAFVTKKPMPGLINLDLGY